MAVRVKQTEKIMSASIDHLPNPKLDLILERVVDVPSHLIWAAWTQPELLKKWFTPAPWQTTDCEIDLRPGGIFRTVMRGPDGPEFSNVGCYLEIVECKKLVWTGALGPGYRPLSSDALTKSPFFMTAVISLASKGPQTKYTAWVMHGDEGARKQHEQMGFNVGWGKALDQLVELIKKS
jgi:uncharacterized protein YndB with AHSA1/START domain